MQKLTVMVGPKVIIAPLDANNWESFIKKHENF